MPTTIITPRLPSLLTSKIPWDRLSAEGERSSRDMLFGWANSKLACCQFEH